jgi:hypothetical protein
VKVAAWLYAAMTAIPLSGSEPRAFLDAYCVQCHGAEKQKGERRFDELALPVRDLDGVIAVQDILDQINLGEMPPKKAKQPGGVEREKVVEALTAMVAEARKGLSSTGGEGVLRRLNRREYLNTVGDLLALDMRLFDPTTKFPQDQMAEHLDTLGDVLQTSGYLLAQYLEAADRVVEKVFSVRERPTEQRWHFDGDFRPQQEHSYPHGRVYGNRYLCVYEVPDTVNHEGGLGFIHDFRDGVPVDGVYEIRVKAQAMHREHPYDPAIFKRDTAQPFRLGIVPGDKEAGPLHHPQPIEPQLAEVTLNDGEPEWHTMTVPLNAGQTPRFIFPNGMANSRRAFGVIARQYKDQWPEEERKDLGIFEARRVVLKYGKMPHIRIHEVEVRGPLVAAWPPASQRRVTGEQGFAPERTRELLQRFADRAYRRPATAGEVDRLMKVVEARLQSGSTPFEGFKDGIKAALCSPGFLYLDAGRAADGSAELSDHALASRLSYFLWASMPDDELLAVAARGELRKPEVRVAQVRRMLADRKSGAFVDGFLDAWLNLRALGDMPPDRDAFERFYSQDLKAAMKTETRLFMRQLLDENGSALLFLDADYTFVNQALADLYGLGRIGPPEEAAVFRRVSLPDGRRGGLLGQASTLTVSANGIETSPVTRGVWLLENVLGSPPPPPPDNVPPIDPDVRGAKSMREILSKHRDNPGCFECHQKIDPLGFALENFDPIGAWRTRYAKGPKIDASGELPDGQRFEDVTGLKRVLVERKEQFARMLTEEVLSYACGRRMEALDRPEVDRILAAFAADGYRLRTLVEQVVLSAPFGNR